MTGRSELREQLIGLRRQRAAVQTQLNDVRRDMTGQKRSFKRTFSDLERFFPNEEFRTCLLYTSCSNMWGLPNSPALIRP